jgi:hypothetical protein
MYFNLPSWLLAVVVLALGIKQTAMVLAAGVVDLLMEFLMWFPVKFFQQLQ